MNPDTFYKGLIVLLAMAALVFAAYMVIDTIVFMWRKKRGLKGSFKMKKRIKIDRETGFPRVPSGCHWEVEQEIKGPFDSHGRVLVILRDSDGTGWLSPVSDSNGLELKPYEVRKRDIRRTAKNAYWRWVKDWYESPFIGTYPPKTLRGVK